jgi:hypothetical protein
MRGRAGPAGCGFGLWRPVMAFLVYHKANGNQGKSEGCQNKIPTLCAGRKECATRNFKTKPDQIQRLGHPPVKRNICHRWFYSRHLSVAAQRSCCTCHSWHPSFPDLRSFGLHTVVEGRAVATARLHRGAGRCRLCTAGAASTFTTYKGSREPSSNCKVGKGNRRDLQQKHP